MPRLHLTDIAVRNLKPDRYRTFYDLQLRGFGVRCGLARKTWVVMVGKHRQRITLGRYPEMTLRDARSAAKALMSRTHSAPDTLSFAQALDQYCELHLAPNTKPTSARASERLLRKHFLPTFDRARIGEITAREIMAIPKAMAHTPAEANLALGALKAMLNWCAAQYLIPHNPVGSARMPFKRIARDRVLSDDELRRLLETKLSDPFDGLMRCLIYTGQRRQQFAALKWSYIGPEKITWPREDMKANKAHTIPLTPSVRAIIEKQAHLGDYVFASPIAPDRPFSGWSKAMEALRDASGVKAFTAHDWRRTCSTNLNRLGVAPSAVEHLLAHAQPKIAGIYNRYQYQSEIADALHKYAEFIRALTADVPAEQT